ncbi:MAG: phosphate signaling complex protein PhoU [Endomicrobiales bacterium]|nr:phosphate signaling complex protein PhoU [Endomicrobiales bacterium]
MIEEKLVSLKKDLIDYANLVEKMVSDSIDGLLKKNRSKLKEIIVSDEPKANAYEIEIDEHSTNLIAQYQPKAKNLRLLLMILRMGNDLERMGDHAVNIVESALFLIDKPQIKPFIDLPKMAEVTVKMLSNGINAFINENSAVARKVCESDNLVDDFKDKITAELTEIMRKNPQTVEQALHVLRITGNLERIADLSTNICEDVMYLTEGRVIKHHQEERNG